MVDNKKKTPDWRVYEQIIFEHFRGLYPDREMTFDQKLVGVNSKQKRQIDILITEKIADFPINIVIDCKHFSRKVDVKAVDSFIGMLEDVRANKGAIITNIGYSEAAIWRAKTASRDIKLDIIEFEDLPFFEGVNDGFAYRYNDEETTGVIFSCPFGWQIHKTPKLPFNDFRYPAGLTKEKVDWKKGFELKECIYIEFSRKEDYPKLEDLFAVHENNSKESFANCEFDYFEEELDERFENHFSERVVLRNGYYPQYPEIESTIFVDFGTFYTFFVLNSPKKNKDQNLKKLAFIARTCLPYDLPEKTDVLPIEYLKLNFME